MGNPRTGVMAGDLAAEFMGVRGVIEMVMGEDDVLDVLRIETELPDAFDRMLREGTFDRVDQDEALGRRDQPRRGIAHADVIQIVEDLEGCDLLQGQVVRFLAEARRASVWRLSRRLSRGVNAREAGSRQRVN
jgi:hypothetical protein